MTPPRIRRFPVSGRGAGFTLAEVVVSSAIMFVLMGGLTAAIVLVTRALPRSDESAQAAENLTIAAETITDDLVCAISVDNRSSNILELTIPDRTGDNLPEVVAYSWNGVAGQPVTRSMNGATYTLLAAAGDFTLSFETRTKTQLELAVGDITSSETLIAQFSGWGGLGSWAMYPLSDLTRTSQSFSTLTAVPADALSLTLTRASLVMACDTSAPAETYYIQLYDTAADGNTPSGSGIGTPTVVPPTGLTGTPTRRTFSLTGTTTDDPFKGFAIVGRGGPEGYAQVQQYNYTDAPANDTIGQWSINTGSTWMPPAAPQTNRYDHPFDVYGTWVTRVRNVTSVSRHYITRIQVSMQARDAKGTRLVTAAYLLNQPEVASP